jgi:hypothetical protein
MEEEMNEKQSKGYFENHVTHMLLTVVVTGCLHVAMNDVPDLHPIVQFVCVTLFGCIMYVILHPSPNVPDGPVQLVVGLIASGVTAWFVYDKVMYDFITLMVAALVFAVVFTALSWLFRSMSEMHA